MSNSVIRLLALAALCTAALLIALSRGGGARPEDPASVVRAEASPEDDAAPAEDLTSLEPEARRQEHQVSAEIQGAVEPELTPWNGVGRESRVILTVVRGRERLAGHAVKSAKEGELRMPGGSLTGRDGVVEIYSRATRTRRIDIESPGLEWTSSHVVTFPREGETRSVRIELPTARAEGSVAFAVVDARSRTPVRGARIVASAHSGATSVTTDEDGVGLLPWEEGTRYTVSHPDYTRSTIVPDESSEPVEVELRRPIVLFGRAAVDTGRRGSVRVVMRDPSASPPPGERTSLQGFQFTGEERALLQGPPSVVESTPVGSDGSWEIKLVAPASGDPLEVASVTLETGDGKRDLPAQARVYAGDRIEILDPWMDAPVRSLRVRLDGGTALPMGTKVKLFSEEDVRSRSATVNSNGRAELGRLLGDRWTAQVGLSPRIPLHFDATGHAELELDGYGVLELGEVPEDVPTGFATNLVVRAGGQRFSRRLHNKRPAPIAGVPMDTDLKMDVMVATGRVVKAAEATGRIGQTIQWTVIPGWKEAVTAVQTEWNLSVDR